MAVKLIKMSCACSLMVTTAIGHFPSVKHLLLHNTVQESRLALLFGHLDNADLSPVHANQSWLGVKVIANVVCISPPYS